MKKPLLLLFILALAGGAYYWWQQQQAIEQAQPLTLYGNVDIRDVSLSFRVSGRISELLLEEGDSVQQGQRLGLLDAEPFSEAVDLAKADLAAAQAQLAKMKAGSRPEEIAQAKAQLQQQQAVLRNAQRLLERQSSLIEKGATAKQNYDDALAARDEAKARVATAQESLRLTQAGFRIEDIAAAKAQVQAAEARLAQAQTQLHDTELTAPNDGTVLTRLHEVGAIVSAGAPVFTVSLDQPVWVRTYIDEPLLGDIYPQQAVWVYTDSRPAQPYRGQIGYISPQAEFTPKTVETTQLRTDLVYRVRVVVDNPDLGLRQGMPVTIRFDAPASEQAHGQ